MSDAAIEYDSRISRDTNSLDLSMRAAAKAMQTPGVGAMDQDVRQALLFDGSVAVDGARTDHNRILRLPLRRLLQRPSDAGKSSFSTISVKAQDRSQSSST